MSGIDFKNFKKISSDKNTTTLRHKNGHELKIAHGALTDKMRSDLEKLSTQKDCSGGSVKYAGGGSVQKFAEQGDVQTNNDVSSDDSSQKAQTPVVINVGGPQSQPQQPVTGNAPSGTPNALMPSGSNAYSQPQAQPDQAPVQSQSAQQDQQAVAPMPSNDQVDQSGASQPQAQPSQDQQQAAPPQDEFTANKMNVSSDLKNEDAAWAQDLKNGHITPETYGDLFAKKSTLGKIGSIFGLMISGAGAGLSHQPNALLEMMNNEISRDLEAQKQSKSNAQNFISMNNQHQVQQAQAGLAGAQTTATKAEANIKADTLAHMQANRAALHSMVDMVNKLPPGSPERQNAEQQLGMISNGVDSMNSNLADQAASKGAFMKMLMGGQPGGESGEEQFQKQNNMRRMLGPQGETMAKNAEDKHFPGLKGQASVPLSGDDRSSINSGIEFDQKLHRFMDWTQDHSGDLSISDRNKGEALAAELQGSYRQATNGGVYKEGEQNFISKLVASEPTKFFNSIRVMPQLEAIAQENNSRVNQLVKSKGFSGYDGGYKDQPQAETKSMNGVQYQKVQGGWKRVQ